MIRVRFQAEDRKLEKISYICIFQQISLAFIHFIVSIFISSLPWKISNDKSLNKSHFSHYFSLAKNTCRRIFAKLLTAFFLLIVSFSGLKSDRLSLRREISLSSSSGEAESFLSFFFFVRDNRSSHRGDNSYSARNRRKIERGDKPMSVSFSAPGQHTMRDFH